MDFGAHETPRHGEDNWELEDMDWDPATGRSTFRYERSVLGLTEVQVVVRTQPSLATHEGWSTRDQSERVFGFWPALPN